MISFLSSVTVDGVALWTVLLICAGVFLGSLMDAIAGGGGIITVPTYIMGLSRLPIYNALGTNKLSSGHSWVRRVTNATTGSTTSSRYFSTAAGV